MTTNFPTVMSPNDLQSALTQSKVNETSAGGGSSFLKIVAESGDWLFGKDQDDVGGDEILVNTASLQHGWILWSGNRAKKVMVKFTQDLPEAPEPIVTGPKPEDVDYPSEGRSFQGAMVDDGENFTFDTNSYGGRKAVDILLGEIKAQAASGSDYLYPKVKLMKEEPYLSKKGKKIHNPVFEIVAWCDIDGNEEGEATVRIEQEAEAPAKTAKAEKPKRQRRSRKAAQETALPPGHDLDDEIPF